MSRPGDLDEASLPPKRGPQQLAGARRNIAVALAMTTWPAAGRGSAAVLYSCWACGACALAGILNHLQNAAHVPGAYRRAATPQTVPLVELNRSCATAPSRQAGDQDRKLNTTAPPANYVSHSLLPPPGCWITLVGCFSECWGFPGRLASLMQARPFPFGLRQLNHEPLCGRFRCLGLWWCSQEESFKSLNCSWSRRRKMLGQNLGHTPSLAIHSNHLRKSDACSATLRSYSMPLGDQCSA